MNSTLARPQQPNPARWDAPQLRVDTPCVRPRLSVTAAAVRSPGRLARWLAPAADHLLGLHRVREIYDRTADTPAASFPARALAALEVSIDLREDDLKRVPAAGPVILAANHPFG